MTTHGQTHKNQKKPQLVAHEEPSMYGIRLTSVYQDLAETTTIHFTAKNSDCGREQDNLSTILFISRPH